MDRLERARRPIRNELRKVINELDLKLNMELLEAPAVKVTYEIMVTVEKRLCELNEQIYEQMLDADVDEQAIEDELETVRSLKTKFMLTKEHAESILAEKLYERATTKQEKSSGDRQKIKLPTVELKTFGGDLKQWLGWWSQFKKIHESKILDDSDKFYYLAQYMEPGSEPQSLVESYPHTGENYSKAINALEERYGRQDLLLQVYVRELLTLVISNATKNTKLPLAQLHVKLESHLRCLSELKLDKADPATWLFPLVESCLSEELLRAWQRSDFAKKEGQNMKPPKSRLDFLMDFIQSEVRCEQQITLAQAGFRALPIECTPRKLRSRGATQVCEDVATAAGLVAGTIKEECVFCGKPHTADRCLTAQSKTLEERKKIIEQKGACYCCLVGKHRAKRCHAAVRCVVCGKKHFPIMCPNIQGNVKEDVTHKQMTAKVNVNTVPTVELDSALVSGCLQDGSSVQCSSDVVLNTLVAELDGQHGRKFKVRIIGDTGSQRSWIRTSTVQKVGCKPVGEEFIQSLLFGGKVTQPLRHYKYFVALRDPQGGSPVKIELLEQNQICSRIPRISKGPWLDELLKYGIEYSDVGGYVDVDILVGNDYWGSLLTGRIIKLQNGLVAIETILGWTISGRIQQSLAFVHLSLLNGTSQELDLSKLWNLEILGIRDPMETVSIQQEEIEVLKTFSKTIARNPDGSYVVALPWKTTSDAVSQNFIMAKRRLENATKRLISSDKFNTYSSVFKSWEKEGFISVVNEDERTGHYLPHRPVFKETSLTTPVRPVFDASAKVGIEPSINACLFTGPNLLELIPTLLLRFREKRLGVSSDIRKAFQMIHVREEDKKYQKFLWWEDASCSKVKVFIHNRVVFGLTCSPFILGATIQHHLSQCMEDQNLVKKLSQSFYVDNCVTSVDSWSDYEEFKYKAVALFKDAGMDLRQWTTTSYNGSLGRVGDNNDGEVEVAILGLNWNREKDTLSCIVKNLNVPESITKRYILSVAAQLFDPIGFLCPTSLIPKIIIQGMWKDKIGWDEALPMEKVKQFRKWIKEIGRLKAVHIPRRFQLSSASTRAIHVFVDASNVA